MNNQYERFRQQIGRFEVFLRGSDADVILCDPAQNVQRNLTAQEALQLLTWLYSHKKDLYEIVRRNEQTCKEE